jgi:hypothetical protein
MKSYWSQWNHDEVLSMHGIEKDTNMYHDEVDTEVTQDSCSDCMECFGLSWRDFM